MSCLILKYYNLKVIMVSEKKYSWLWNKNLYKYDFLIIFLIKKILIYNFILFNCEIFNFQNPQQKLFI